MRENLGNRAEALRGENSSFKTSVQNERLGNPSRSGASIKHDWALLIAGRGAAGISSSQVSRTGGVELVWKSKAEGGHDRKEIAKCEKPEP